MAEKNEGKILIADDEPDIIAFLSYNLKNRGYTIAAAANGAEMIRKAREFQPDLILLDVMMPQKDGIAALRELRTIPGFQDTAVILLTALTGERHEIEGLRTGADDYITKPIKPELLATRIQAALRRVKGKSAGADESEEKIETDGLVINKTRFTVTYEEQDIVLARKEFELLYLLAGSPGRVFLRQEILQRVWGSDVIVGDRTIDVHIRKIRQKTGLDLITTVKGVGYKFHFTGVAA